MFLSKTCPRCGNDIQASFSDDAAPSLACLSCGHRLSNAERSAVLARLNRGQVDWWSSPERWGTPAHRRPGLAIDRLLWPAIAPAAAEPVFLVRPEPGLQMR